MIEEKVLYISSKGLKKNNNSLFTIELDPVINIPYNVTQVNITCLNVEFINRLFNVSNELKNNKLYYTDVLTYDLKFILFEDGIYNINTINDIIKSHFSGVDVLSFGVIELNKKIELKIWKYDFKVLFDFDDSIGKLLGFTGVHQSPSYSYNIIKASNITQFNPFSTIFIHMNIDNTTSSFNGKPSNIVDSIAVNSDSIIKHNPPNPIVCSCNGLIGSNLSSIDFWLSDKDNNILNLSGEDWDGKFLIEIIY